MSYEFYNLNLKMKCSHSEMTEREHLLYMEYWSGANHRLASSLLKYSMTKMINPIIKSIIPIVNGNPIERL